MLFWESLCSSVAQLQGTKHVPGSLAQRSPNDQNTGGFANKFGFPSISQYRDAVIQYVGHNAQLFPHRALAQALRPHARPGVEVQN